VRESIQDWLTDAEVQLLRESFLRLIPSMDALSDQLYDRLFTGFPETRRLFPDDIGELKQKLVAMLATAVDLLMDREHFQAACRELGLRHVGYGTKTDHYAILGAILIDSLGAVAGPDFTPEELGVWTQFYLLVAQEMIIGSRQTSSEPLPM
jgi:hemoglobin-like flavoprotein